MILFTGVKDLITVHCSHWVEGLECYISSWKHLEIQGPCVSLKHGVTEPQDGQHNQTTETPLPLHTRTHTHTNTGTSITATQSGSP